MESELSVGGMTCGGCVRSVERVLRELPGVVLVEVSLAEGCARVRHDEALSPRAVLVEAVVAAGFEAT